MHRERIRNLALIFLAAAAGLQGQQWKAGAAVVSITPQMPVWMAGYGNRDKPSQGVAQELHAKALAIEDPSGSRVVIVTSDLIGFVNGVSEAIACQARERFELPRERLVLSSSHTHTGPTLGNSLRVMYDFTPEQSKAVEDYTQYLQEQVVEVIGKAIANLAPSRLTFHRGQAGFAMNRRQQTPDGVKLAMNPKGPVDHDVPVLRVSSMDGKPIAVLFSYACHNTTLTGNHYEFHGDYAGEAQRRVESAQPGVVALFMMGCGADANPEPRGEMAHVEQHGEELAAAVAGVMSSDGRSVDGDLRAELIRFPIPLAPAPSRGEFEARAKDPNRFVRRHAAEHLELLASGGRIPTDYSYPLQAVQLGGTVTLVALAGEVVVGYALQLKERLGEESTWPVAYANDVFAYIPTKEILSEGGYEADRSQVYYGQPGPWAPAIEATILGKAVELVKRVRAPNRP
ncbi:MAG: neutral/alkaline non-lysosomal ceramidase N-terminal domain-containing protein [Bryobacterales bacterium]